MAWIHTDTGRQIGPLALANAPMPSADAELLYVQPFADLTGRP